jgi:predicted nucleic acid-binding protein
VKYLIDSDWVIDRLRGIKTAAQAIDTLSDSGVAVSIVSLGKIFEGAFTSSDVQASLQLFHEYLADFPIVPLTDPIRDPQPPALLARPRSQAVRSQPASWNPLRHVAEGDR